MKIQKINTQNAELLRRLFQLQIDSYSVEAKLIGSSEIPTLKETLDALRKSKEIPWGLFEGDLLKGAIFVEETSESITISKLIIDPSEFRKGHGKKLVEHVLSLYRSHMIEVATASRNVPARSLYEKLGFKFHSEHNTSEGIQIVHYEKP